MTSLYIALVHYPVLNKEGREVMTSVTNLDIHDIARSARTYGVKRYYIVHPDASQQAFLNSMLGFWQQEQGLNYNADRSEALSIVELCSSIEQTIEMITTQERMQPILISTTAQQMNAQASYQEISNLLSQTRPLLLIFGTGHGLSSRIHALADYCLKPIIGTGDYNHLSVRSAAAIILDRITSRCI